MISTLSDLLKHLVPDVKPMRSQTKAMGSCTCDFYRAFSKLMVFARNSDWFIALFVNVVIGQDN